ncbi:hypothetical protein PAECIP111893_01078 [Paenibacillus plantiphilus]|uniref:Spore coat protein D n=1 Tax=Paenibacillus plantiphilus TaxID=2905650 RepID=A0ABN8G388_9BACL|nr:hypothetical protein PAECIP111893_01078 [Paenibacillus plantiphilus]
MSFYPQCPTQTVYDPPVTLYENFYHPQVVQVIHPIEVVNQHHCVPTPHHFYTYSTKDVMCNVSSVKSKKRSRKK